jgi:hypothetical protein
VVEKVAEDEQNGQSLVKDDLRQRPEDVS